jgi:hypothetical protein
VEKHLRCVSAFVSRLVDSPNDKIPRARINVPIHLHLIAYFQLVALREVGADDARISFALECCQLISWNEEFRVEIEIRLSVDGKPGKKLVFVNIRATEPVRMEGGR